MNADAVARHYDCLTPEERFRLIEAAGGRGDTAEQDRLANVGQRITLSMRDFAPFALAFDGAKPPGFQGRAGARAVASNAPKTKKR
jgi:hypothetical protein